MRTLLMALCVGTASLVLGGCAPGHTLKEVLHNPNLLAEEVNAQGRDSALATADQTAAPKKDNVFTRADRWMQKNLW